MHLFSRVIETILGKTVWDQLTWNIKYFNVRNPKKQGAVGLAQEDYKVIEEQLRILGFEIISYIIDVEDYRKYIEDAEYSIFQYYDGGKAFNFPEKSLEHYISSKMLKIKKNDIYIDIANDNSPVPEIYQKLFNCIAYRQDIIYDPGVTGNVIGGSAGAMPLANNFADKFSLNCSFEHFEGNEDISFLLESDRVLKKGGILVICPLYVNIKHSIQTDLFHVTNKEINTFDKEAVLYCTRGWNNRHGRFYEPLTLNSRVRKNCGSLKLKIVKVENAVDVDSSCYLKYIALFEKE
jgi:hypothetical protein